MIYPVFFIRKFHIISVTSGQDGIISAWNLHSDILKRHIHQLFNLFFLNDPFFCICGKGCHPRTSFLRFLHKCLITLFPDHSRRDSAQMHSAMQNMPDGSHYKVFCRSVLADLWFFDLIDTQDHAPAHRPVQLFFHLCLIIRNLIIRKDINIESGNASRLLQTVFHKTSAIHA